MITNIPTLDRENYGRFLGLLPLTGPGWLVGAIEKSFGSGPLAGEGAPPIRPAYTPSQGSMAEDLEKLARLRAAGTITEEEFQRLKAKLI